MKFALLFVGLLAACQPQPTSDSAITAPETTPTAESPEESMQQPITLENEDHPAVTKVVYTEANGSLPPPSQYKNDFEWVSGGPDFEKMVNTALDQTRVNGVVSLRGYMILNLRNDPRFAQVQDISADDMQPTGGQSETLTFVLADGFEFVVSNYSERFEGQALVELKKGVKAQGVAKGLPSLP